VDGLVLCSTATRFVYRERVSLLASAAVPALLQATRVTDVVGRLPIRRLGVAPSGFVATRSRALGAWAANELRRHDLRSIAESGISLSTYDASSWIGEVDVPTSVVITTRDRAVDVTRQLRMARAIRGATVHYIADGHLTCAGRTVFAPAVVAACDDVAARLDPAPASARLLGASAPTVPEPI
jgi:hypothetical protein